MMKDAISLETSLFESKPHLCLYAPKKVRLFLARDWNPVLAAVAATELCCRFFPSHVLSQAL